MHAVTLSKAQHVWPPNLLAVAVCMVEPGVTQRASMAAIPAPRPEQVAVNVAAGDCGLRDQRAELDIHPVAAPVLTRPRRAAAQPVLLDQDRHLGFQRLDGDVAQTAGQRVSTVNPVLRGTAA